MQAPGCMGKVYAPQKKGGGPSRLVQKPTSARLSRFKEWKFLLRVFVCRLFRLAVSRKIGPYTTWGGFLLSPDWGAALGFQFWDPALGEFVVREQSDRSSLLGGFFGAGRLRAPGAFALPSWMPRFVFGSSSARFGEVAILRGFQICASNSSGCRRLRWLAAFRFGVALEVSIGDTSSAALFW